MILFIVTGYNCESFVQSCAESILNQKGDWRAVFISDGSTDRTNELVFSLPNPEIISETYHENKGAAYRRYHAIHNYAKPDDIIALVGMDDELIKGAAAKVQDKYDGGALCTYGNYITDGGQVYTRELLYFDSLAHHERSYREHRYRSTHLCTFKAELFFRLSEKDFQVNGEWIKATTESPAMFAALEMAGNERIGIIEEPIYFYRNRHKQKAKFRFGKQYQTDIYKEIISRPKFDLI